MEHYNTEQPPQVQAINFTTDLKVKQNTGQNVSTDPMFYKTLYPPAYPIKAQQVLLNDQFEQIQKNASTLEKRMKSLPQIKPINKTLYAPAPKEGIGRLYKGIFTPRVGRVLGTLTKRKHEIEVSNLHGNSNLSNYPAGKAFLTDRSIEDPREFGHRHSSLQRNIKLSEMRATPAKSQMSTNKSSLKLATEKLLDEIMGNGSHSLRTQLAKFIETGEKSHLFFCDYCAHCRVKSGDYYQFKKRIEKAKENEEYIFDYFDLNKTMKNSKVFLKIFIVIWKEFKLFLEKKINEKVENTENELFDQFIENLIDKKLQIEDLIDKEMLNEIKKSVLYKNTNFEQDCKKFVKSLHNSMCIKLIYPDNLQETAYIEKKLKSYENTTFERFAKQFNEPKTKPFIKDENYSTILYLYFLYYY